MAVTGQLRQIWEAMGGLVARWGATPDLASIAEAAELPSHNPTQHAKSLPKNLHFPAQFLDCSDVVRRVKVARHESKLV